MWIARISDAGLSLETRIRRTWRGNSCEIVIESERSVEYAYKSIGCVCGLYALDYIGEVLCKLFCSLGIYPHVFRHGD